MLIRHSEVPGPSVRVCQAAGTEGLRPLGAGGDEQHSAHAGNAARRHSRQGSAVWGGGVGRRERERRWENERDHPYKSLLLKQRGRAGVFRLK